MYEQGFLCTKPLQLLMALNISSSIPCTSLITVVEPISGIGQNSLDKLAPAFSKNSAFLAFSSRKDALKHLSSSCKKLFVDDDTADQYFWNKKQFSEINLFEEGFGTYLWPTNALSIKQKFYWFKHRLLTGWDRRAGYSRTTSNIWIQRPDVFKKLNPSNRKNLIKINTSIIDFIKFRFDDLRLLWPITALDTLPKVQDIHIFAPTIGGGGTHMVELMNSLSKKNCCVLLKPHPHDKEINPKIITSNKILIQRDIPLEFLVVYLEKIFNGFIYIYTEGSSSSIYLKRNSRVCFLATASVPRLAKVYDLW